MCSSVAHIAKRYTVTLVWRPDGSPTLQLMSSMPPPPPPMSPPPGYVAYGGPDDQSGGTFRRIGGLTKALVTLNVIGIVASALSVLVQLTLRGDARDYRNGAITSTAFADKLGPYLAVSALAGSIALAALIVQIIWVYRMAGNLRVLRRPKQSFAPGATIAINILGGCTLGILPYFMWRELWKGSDPAAPAGDPGWKQRPVGQIVHIWLAATLLTVVASIGLGVGSAVTRINRGSNATLAKQLDSQFGFVVLAGVFGIVTAVVFLALIRQLASRHMQSTREI
jgi:hypothetical protein